MLPTNEKALEQAQPKLWEALRKTNASTTAELVPSRRGGPALVWLNADGRRKFLHSKIDPEAEAQKMAEAAIRSNAENGGSPKHAVLIGHGAGHEIRAMARLAPRVTVVVPNPPLLRFLCEHLDLSDIFLNPRVNWICGSPEDSRRELESMLKTSGGIPEIIIHQPFLETFPPQYADLLAAVRQIQSGRDTEDILRPIAEQNVRMNFQAFSSPGVSALFGLARGRPALVVAAGTSLDAAVDRLAQYYPNSILIAVDTVAEGLAQQGLAPDIVVSIDPRPESCMHFRQFTGVDCILVFTPISHPDIVRKFEGRRALAIPKNHFFLKPLEQAMPQKGVLMGGGTVSILTAALAAAMEPAFVGLAGVDFKAGDARFYSSLASYHRQADTSGRFSSAELVEHEILSGEINKAAGISQSPRLKHYASDFRILVRQSPVPFYSFGPAPVEGVRSGGMPCMNAPRLTRPIRIPKSDPAPIPAAKEIFELLGMST